MCKQKSWHFLKRLAPRWDVCCQKQSLTSMVASSKLFKRGIYKRHGNEFKNI